MELTNGQWLGVRAGMVGWCAPGGRGVVETLIWRVDEEAVVTDPQRRWLRASRHARWRSSAGISAQNNGRAVDVLESRLMNHGIFAEDQSGDLGRLEGKLGLVGDVQERTFLHHGSQAAAWDKDV